MQEPTDVIIEDIKIEPVKPDVPPVPKPPVDIKPKKERMATPTVSITRYKLNFRRLDGQIRYDLKKEVVLQMVNNYGDLLRTISHNKFMTMEEIVDATWEFEKRSPKKLWERSRKAIEDGVRTLVDNGIVIEK